MIWILIRHAHRDTADRAQDNGLSKKGREQAKRLRKYFEERFPEGEGDLVLVTSPKKRCVETIEPIAESCTSEARGFARSRGAGGRGVARLVSKTRRTFYF